MISRRSFMDRLKFPAVIGPAFLALALVGVCGCGGESFPSGSVTGTITYRGKPVETGQVMLFSEPGRAVGSAEISSGGKFEFANPVPTGSYSVAVLPAAEELPAGAEPAAKPTRPAVPAKYQSEVTSGIKADIAEGENSLDLQMK